MSYEAKKIGNLILSQAHTLRVGITNLRLNKLLYLAHGWSLTHSQDGLIRNHFEAWKLGPVIRTVYDQCRVYGEGPIQAEFQHISYETGKLEAITFDDVSSRDRELTLDVVRFYDDHTTFQLVELTHEKGGPWDEVVHQDSPTGSRIPHELIRSHFRAKIGDSARN